ncbi:FAST kinase domain-containing protein 2, mitochondrial [Halichoeres trimaculatus]|uniref:FAST kinase domain-containing protein 2, mitochondrial n=1 Tax=Halichoeres trimaculatus TaxID=147232 RepID=UPI003D9E183A
MSLWRTEEIMRLGIRVFCLRTLIKSSLIHNLTPRLTQTPLTGPAVPPVRFYSQEKTHSLSSLPPSEVQSDDPTSEHQQKLPPYVIHLQQCASPSDVLDLTCKYAPTPRQASKSVSHMWFCAKKMTEEQRRYELQLMFQHPAFDPLLQNAMKNVDGLRSEDLVYCLLSMVKLGVPQRSRIVQTFLRSCQEKLNSFDEKGLAILSTCLHQMESSPNVTALKEGVSLVIESRLSEIQNVIALQTMMRLVGKSASPEFKWKLEEKALSMQDKFSLPNTQHMLTTMATMDLRSKPLLEFCSKKLRENLPSVPFSRLYDVLRACSDLQYRNKDLFTDISDYLGSAVNIWSNKQMILLLHMFENLGFCPDASLEVFAKQVIANPDALTLKDLLCILKVYSSLNYDLQHHRQQFLDSVSRIIESYLPKMSYFDLLRVVYRLCLLNHFPPAPLERLLQDNTLEHPKSPSPKLLMIQDNLLRTVDLCLRLDHPPLPQPLAVPSSALGDSTFAHRATTWFLSQCLQEVMEEQAGAELQEGVLVENFYFIDAVITKPLLCSSSVPEGGEASAAERSHRVALLSTPPSQLCFGTSRPRGPLACKIRHLRILGYEPVMLQENKLQALSPETRTEFLRELIFPEHHNTDTN